MSHILSLQEWAPACRAQQSCPIGLGTGGMTSSGHTPAIKSPQEECIVDGRPRTPNGREDAAEADRLACPVPLQHHGRHGMQSGRPCLHQLWPLHVAQLRSLIHTGYVHESHVQMHDALCRTDSVHACMLAWLAVARSCTDVMNAYRWSVGRQGRLSAGSPCWVACRRCTLEVQTTTLSP